MKKAPRVSERLRISTGAEGGTRTPTGLPTTPSSSLTSFNALQSFCLSYSYNHIKITHSVDLGRFPYASEEIGHKLDTRGRTKCTPVQLALVRFSSATMTHDYKRNGTTTLFAALSVLEGRVIGQCLPRHRHQEFLKFLRHLDREFPKEIPLHLILDNYGTHKHPNVTRWLSKHPRFQLHFTPTSSSWLNLVERWFRELTQKRLRRGVFRSVPELIAGIEGFLASYNHDPKPFVWTASANAIIDKVSRCKVILETQH